MCHLFATAPSLHLTFASALDLDLSLELDQRFLEILLEILDLFYADAKANEPRRRGGITLDPLLDQTFDAAEAGRGDKVLQRVGQQPTVLGVRHLHREVSVNPAVIVAYTCLHSESRVPATLHLLGNVPISGPRLEA